MADWAEWQITDGTGQSSRFPSALQNGYFNVDEMAFEELLAMSAEYASALRFHNLKNEPDGSWADLFTADEAVIMAKILSTDLSRLESEFIDLV